MNTPPDFKHLDSPDEWTQAFPVMQELRPHLQDAASFARQMRRQREEHYRLLAARDASGAVLGLAGYRLQTNTLYGRFLYVDDLVVTARQQRSVVLIARISYSIPACTCRSRSASTSATACLQKACISSSRFRRSTRRPRNEGAVS
jgi:hypothetical protein